MNLSAVVIAQDEEERIVACIESLRPFCDEVLLVDGGSRDRTVTLARQAGARVVERPFDDFARQHEFARGEARGEWVLSLDAGPIWVRSGALSTDLSSGCAKTV